ncbi:hypothetical protein C2S52_023264 [Perilla frutescens var. hirtella]|nr:hypothetical protein C2S52_023264 [Perilla frutescens var. hirtella]
MESLSMDGRGMLSLYEASYLAFDGKNILDEAREFRSFHLNNMMTSADVDKKFGERVRHALELPSHHRMPRLETRWNIEMAEIFDPTLWADLCKSFLREAKWNHTKQIPKLDEYLNHGWISSSMAVLLTHAYFLITPNLTVEAMKSLNDDTHGLLRLPCTLFRLTNDLSSFKEDFEKGQFAKAVSCYMHETGSSDEAACAYIKKLIDQNWKKFYEDVTYNAIFGKHFNRTCCNLARNCMCRYNNHELILFV